MNTYLGSQLYVYFDLHRWNSAVFAHLPGNIQGQVGRGLDHPGLVEGVPAHGRGVEWDDL